MFMVKDGVVGKVSRTKYGNLRILKMGGTGFQWRMVHIFTAVGQ